MLNLVLFSALSHYFFGFVLSIAAVFLILLVLVQRGRGGGLSGAFGGAGGQSAFGTKAGDVFTKITVGASITWILLCMAATKFLQNTEDKFTQNAPITSVPAPSSDIPAAEGPGAGSTTLPPTVGSESNDSTTTTPE